MQETLDTELRALSAEVQMTHDVQRVIYIRRRALEISHVLLSMLVIGTISKQAALGFSDRIRMLLYYIDAVLLGGDGLIARALMVFYIVIFRRPAGLHDPGDTPSTRGLSISHSHRSVCVCLHLRGTDFDAP